MTAPIIHLVKISDEAIRALDEAIEGECEGLSVSAEKLVCILEHVAPLLERAGIEAYAGAPGPVILMPRSSAWQPIDTAPKDGTEFLAYDPSTGKMAVCDIVTWSTGGWSCSPTQVDSQIDPHVREFGGNGPQQDYQWMPLPSPPVPA